MNKVLLCVEIWRDGKFVEHCDTDNSAFMRLLQLQPFSTYYALRWGGWMYKHIYDEKDIHIDL